MRKSALLVSVALLGVLLASPVAHAAKSTGDTKKAYADVVDGRAVYQSVSDVTTATSSEVLAQMDLGAAACKNITYTMTVLASSASTRPVQEPQELDALVRARTSSRVNRPCSEMALTMSPLQTPLQPQISASSDSAMTRVSSPWPASPRSC